MNHHESDALHARVCAFIDATGAGLPAAEPFDAIACDLARMQARARTGVEHLLAARGLSPENLRLASEIPAVPTDVFKLRRVACHDQEHDEVVFRTSGTTVGQRGCHAMRTARTYLHAALTWGRVMLFPDVKRVHMGLLAAPFSIARESSLAFMLEGFTASFGTSASWFMHNDELSVEALERLIKRASGEPIFLAGASFAFVHLLDGLGARTLRLPAGSRIMQTGGFKGRTREVEPEQLRARIAATFCLELDAVAGEYGMTELSSQAYEGCVRRHLGLKTRAAPRGIYIAPPWMRVRAVDPVTLAPVAAGEVGLARIEDLANVDSAVVIQTSDRIRELVQGFTLLGREPTATPRGCSIGIDEILSAGAGASS